MVHRAAPQRRGAWRGAVYLPAGDGTLLRVPTEATEYVLVPAPRRGGSASGSPGAQNRVGRAPDKLTLDLQVAVRWRCAASASTSSSAPSTAIPLAPVAPRVFMLHAPRGRRLHPRDYSPSTGSHHQVALPLPAGARQRVITISHDSARRMLTSMPELESEFASSTTG